MQIADKSDRDLLIEIHTKLELLMGNGQPGIISAMQGEIADLKASRERFRGAKWVVGIVGTGAWAFLEFLFHHSR